MPSNEAYIIQIAIPFISVIYFLVRLVMGVFSHKEKHGLRKAIFRIIISIVIIGLTSSSMLTFSVTILIASTLTIFAIAVIWFIRLMIRAQPTLNKIAGKLGRMAKPKVDAVVEKAKPTITKGHFSEENAFKAGAALNKWMNSK